MSATFLVGDRNAVKGILKVPYGILLVEEITPIVVTTMAKGRTMLTKLIEGKHLTSDQATELEEQMHLAGVLENWDAVAEQVLAYVPPEGFVPSWRFEICNRPDCPPVRHGAIIKIADGMEDDRFPSVMTLGDGFDQVRDDRIHTVDAAILLAQMANSNLPRNDIDTVQQQPERPIHGPLDASMHSMTFGLPGGAGRVQFMMMARSLEEMTAEEFQAGLTAFLVFADQSAPAETPTPVAYDPAAEDDDDYDSSNDRGD